MSEERTPCCYCGELRENEIPHTALNCVNRLRAENRQIRQALETQANADLDRIVKLEAENAALKELRDASVKRLESLQNENAKLRVAVAKAPCAGPGVTARSHDMRGCFRCSALDEGK